MMKTNEQRQSDRWYTSIRSSSRKRFYFIDDYNSNCNYGTDPNAFMKFVTIAIENIGKDLTADISKFFSAEKAYRSIIYYADTLMSLETNPKRDYMKDSIEMLPNLPKNVRKALRINDLLTIGEVYEQMTLCNTITKMPFHGYKAVARSIVKYMNSNRCMMNRISLACPTGNMDLEEERWLYGNILNNGDISIRVNTSVRLMIPRESMYQIITLLSNMMTEKAIIYTKLFQIKIEDLREEEIVDASIDMNVIPSNSFYRRLHAYISKEENGEMILKEIYSPVSLPDITRVNCFLCSLYYLSGLEKVIYENTKSR